MERIDEFMDKQYYELHKVRALKNTYRDMAMSQYKTRFMNNNSRML